MSSVAGCMWVTENIKTLCFFPRIRHIPLLGQFTSSGFTPLPHSFWVKKGSLLEIWQSSGQKYLVSRKKPRNAVNGLLVTSRKRGTPPPHALECLFIYSCNAKAVSSLTLRLVPCFCTTKINHCCQMSSSILIEVFFLPISSNIHYHYTFIRKPLFKHYIIS